MAASRNFREVSLQSEQREGTVINFTVGSSTTIRDGDYVKPHAGGGYAYRESGNVDSFTRNRFIVWRITDNVLELVEESLDINLTGNHLELKFTDGVLLPVVYIFETHTHISVLAATTNSVHRIVFSHPDRLRRHGFGISFSTEANQYSIFNDFSSRDLRDASNFGTFTQSCSTFASWLCQDGNCLFALATGTDVILLIKLPPPGSEGQVEQFELRQAGVMQRLWSGLVPSSLRRDTMASDAVMSVGIHPYGKQMCVFALCRDLKLRIWSCQNQSCIYVKDLVEDIPDDVDLQNSPAQSHLLRKVVDPATGRLYLGLFLYLAENTQFCVYEVESLEDGVSLSQVSFSYFPKGNLVDFVVTTSHIWTVWTSAEGETMVYFTPTENLDLQQSGWTRVFLELTENSEVLVPPYKEPREVFLEQLFYPGRFSNHSILKAMQIYRHLPVSNFTNNYDENLSRRDLKQAVINLIDSEIQVSAPDYEMLHDEYNDLQLQCWTKFYSYVVQYHQVGSKAMGIFVDGNTGLVCLVRKEMLSFFRPCELFEQLHLCVEPLDVSLLSSEPSLDKTMKTSFIDFCNVIKMVAHQLSAEHLSSLENDVKYQLNPALTADQIAVYLLTNVSDEEQQDVDTQVFFEFAQELETSLHKVHNLFQSLEFLLQGLDSQGIIRDDVRDDEAGWSDVSNLVSCHHLFSSQLSSSLLPMSSHQMVSSRMAVCKHLLVLLSLITKLSVNKVLTGQNCDVLHVC
ncbi:nuclear pore complex protein Nup160-like [Orbicella faveolata]|uniref:nuclear pore complex protein Nup160-like n=1 Tax=Orbicella faveolata TaxID=48498 RepID=UPI0009E5E708|nr:nuclear pore complex protein Nup160-like [Orbicella faveolata]